MNETKELVFPNISKIFYGKSAISELRSLFVDSKGRALICADANLSRIGLTQKLVDLVKECGIDVDVFDGITSNPTHLEIDSLAERLRQIQPKWILGLGGGSVLDVAKLACAVAEASFPSSHYALCRNPLPKRSSSLVLIPTTSGTGAEVTSTCVFSDEFGKKVWAWDLGLQPDWVILDASLTQDLPEKLTIATGLDALVHALEAFTAQRCQVLTQCYAWRSISLIRENLPRAIREPKHLGARLKLHLAATLAGLSIEQSGTGVAHSIGHALGSLYDVHHGLAVAKAYVATVEWNEKNAPKRFELLGSLFGGQDRSISSSIKDFFLSLPLDLHIDASFDIDQIVAEMQKPENQPMLHNNAMPITETLAQEIGQLLRESQGSKERVH